ncbi:hypothetical protein [Bacillus sp. LJBS17]|uniref:hypothetical protein n=1 Tax=Bacillus sp. LJBS17 TaxID=2859227 RepID=UPI001C5A161D|nr:hypothetical protein [Bacillus sp. LJBS17]QXW84058.1 hypothetical protein KXZ66_22155 [Bacillus sp. LJBS17]
MKTFRKGAKVQLLVDHDSPWGSFPKGTIGKVIWHDKEDEEMSHAEVDFYYKDTEALLREDESLSFWDVEDGPIIHEKDLKLVSSN